MEGYEYVLKALMNLNVSRILPTPKNIIQEVHRLNIEDGKEKLAVDTDTEEKLKRSDRSIRKWLSLLVQSGCVEKRTLSFPKILNADDEIAETNVLATVYEMNMQKAIEGTMNYQRIKLDNSQRVKNSPPELIESVKKAGYLDIENHWSNISTEMRNLESSFWCDGHFIKTPVAKISRDRYYRNLLKIMIDYLKMWEN